MKNYLVIPAATCQKSPQPLGVLEQYEKMAELQSLSAKKHLNGLDEVMIVKGCFETTEILFRHVFDVVYDLWHQEDCNILQTMSDTLFIRDTNIYGVYEDFSLFGLNCGRSVDSTLLYQLDSPRYYPRTMSKETMDYGKKLWEEVGDYWGNELWVYSKMFYQQKEGYYNQKDILIEHLESTKHLACKQQNGYQDQGSLGDYTWTSCDESEASVLEFSATRGHAQVLSNMQNKYEKYCVKED